MRYSTLVRIVSLCISLAGTAASGGGAGWSGSLASQLSAVDSLLSAEGPTIRVLDEYEALLRQVAASDANATAAVEAQLPKLYYKKALVELSLKKPDAAIGDLEACLSHDPNMRPARHRLAQLLLERGDLDRAAATCSAATGQDAQLDDVMQQIAFVRSSLAASRQLVGAGDAQGCLDTLEAVLAIASSSVEAHQLHIDCIGAKDGAKTPDDYRQISQDYLQMIRSAPMRVGLPTYDAAASYLLFTQTEFDKSWGVVKNCLRIDNDYKPCGQKSKLYTRFQELLRVLERYSIVNGYYYMEVVDVASGQFEESLAVSDEEYAWVQRFLFEEPLKVSKADKRSLPYSIATNYDYLQHVVQEFAKSIGEPHVALGDQLQKLACESAFYVKKGNRAACQSIKEDSGNPFLPLHLSQIDKLIKNHKFAEADRLMQKFNQNLRQSRLFQSRYKHIEEHQRVEQQRQQRQHQQHQQQRFQQQQQQRQYHHQQQQQSQHNMSPKTDYYKVLDISKDADEKTIKKAYRTQTLKYHPDKYKGTDLTPEQIESKMQEINLAYEVLSNKESREQYDRGHDPNNPHAGSGGGGAGAGSGGFNFGGFGGDDFFSQFMGGQGGFQFGGGGDGPKVKFKRTYRQG
ncbi:J domain-containing protein [[Candida] zeylanoides]